MSKQLAGTANTFSTYASAITGFAQLCCTRVSGDQLSHWLRHAILGSYHSGGGSQNVRESYSSNLFKFPYVVVEHEPQIDGPAMRCSCRGPRLVLLSLNSGVFAAFTTEARQQSKPLPSRHCSVTLWCRNHGSKDISWVTIDSESDHKPFPQQVCTAPQTMLPKCCESWVV